MTLTAVKEPAGIWDLLCQIEGRSPTAAAMRESGGRHHNFRQLIESVSGCAAGLHRLGIKQGTPVVWRLPEGTDAMILAIALDSLGAEQTPVLPTMDRHRFYQICESRRPSVVIMPGQWDGEDSGAIADAIHQLLRDAWVLYIDKGDLPQADVTALSVEHSPGYSPIWWFDHLSMAQSLAPQRIESRELILCAKGVAQSIEDRLITPSVPVTLSLGHPLGIVWMLALWMKRAQIQWLELC
jgi:acyl-coenzyme A synthetase/AMP-(fatty) acid ligase